MTVKSRIRRLQCIGAAASVILTATIISSCATAKTKSPSVISEYPIPIAGSVPYAGSVRGAVYSLDGVFWFTEPVTNNIGKYAPATGEFSTYPIPTRGAAPDGIAIGIDGNIWFTEHNGNKIALPPGSPLTLPETSGLPNRMPPKSVN